VWQRCDVHFLRNALDYLPRKADNDCLQELRWIIYHMIGTRHKKPVSKRLGHADTHITATVYSHVLEKDKQTSAEVWE
jgi:transposase-like protein